MHMVAHRSSDTDTARGTFGLDSGRHIHCVAVQVCSIGNGVADIDPDTKANGSIWRLISVENWHLLLHLDGTAHGTVDAVEHDEQRIAPSLDDPAAVLVNRRVDEVAAQSPQPFQSSRIVQADQTAIANHIRVDHGDQLSPIWRLTDQV